LTNPENENVFNSLGEAWTGIGNKTEAINAYEKVLVLKPTDENESTHPVGTLCDTPLCYAKRGKSFPLSMK